MLLPIIRYRSEWQRTVPVLAVGAHALLNCCLQCAHVHLSNCAQASRLSCSTARMLTRSAVRMLPRSSAVRMLTRSSAVRMLTCSTVRMLNGAKAFSHQFAVRMLTRLSAVRMLTCSTVRMLICSTVRKRFLTVRICLSTVSVMCFRSLEGRLLLKLLCCLFVDSWLFVFSARQMRCPDLLNLLTCWSWVCLIRPSSLLPNVGNCASCVRNWRRCERIDLMPDKRAGSWRDMWPGRDVAAYAKSVFSTQFSVTFTFLFSQHSRFLSSKKRALATQFSFLCTCCMSTTVSGSNSLSFAIIRDKVWQRALRMTGDTDTAKSSSSSSLLFFFFFFFACFLIFLKKAFSERKDSAGDIPNEGTLQITVQSMTNATFETVGQVRRQSSPVWPPTKKCLYLYFLALLYFLQALLMAKVSYHCLKKYQRVTSLFSKTYPEPALFFCQPWGVRKPVFFLFVNFFLSDC